MRPPPHARGPSPRRAPPYGFGLRRYMREHLHRRLFLWFGLTIVATAGAVTVVAAAFGREGGWRREEALISGYFQNRFAEVWSDPARRDRYAQDVSRDLDLDLVLKDPDGTRLGVFGKDMCDRPWIVRTIRSADATVGSASVCLERHWQHDPWKLAFGFLVVLGILWAASGKVARRLTLPLAELSRVARDLGEGRLKSRYELGASEPGEIGALAESVNEMAARIERQLADQRELMAGVSHELRTPLARIRLLIELIRDLEGGGARLDEIEREVVEIDGLVGELLASARLDFAALVKRPLDAGDLVRRALERAGLEPSLGVIETRETAFEGDVTLLQRALSNLVENAKRHGGGLVALRVAREDGALVFVVEDAGPGFPPDGEGKVFVPFAPRANGEPREAGSLGLGLALVKRIAEAHGGQAFAENREGGGARVGLRIPAK